MKIDIFAEMQQPKEIWDGEGNEHRLIEETLAQAQLADEAGYGCFWLVEHHGSREFSYSSAPELMLTAIAQRTKRMRIGHGAVLGLHKINHPVRIAERAAMLDHLSNGRLELGLTRSGVPEWRLFQVEPAQARVQLQEAYEMITRIWTEERFTWKSDAFDIRDATIVPKPYQKPHPPLWQAAASPGSFEDAGKRGVGVLGTTIWESAERVERMIRLYRAAAAACTEPVGSFVNNQVAYFTFVHCAETDEQAMRNGAAAAAAWYTVTALTFFEAAAEFSRGVAEQQRLMADQSADNLAGQFFRDEVAATSGPTEGQVLIGKVLSGEDVSDEEIFEVLSAQDSLIVGSPDTCRKKLRKYADLGIDRLMCLQQIGSIGDEEVMTSIRLIGELIPEFDR